MAASQFLLSDGTSKPLAKCTLRELREFFASRDGGDPKSVALWVLIEEMEARGASEVGDLGNPGVAEWRYRFGLHLGQYPSECGS